MAEIYYEKKPFVANDLKFIDELISNMTNILIQYGSNDFWKVLKYPSKDALAESDVPTLDRALLVKNGKIKRIPYNNDISTEAHSEVRIFLFRWDGEGNDGYEIRLGIDVISHNSIIELNGGKTSTMVMVHEILDIFNGSKVSKNLGAFTVDGLNGTMTYYNSEYQGYRFYLRGHS